MQHLKNYVLGEGSNINGDIIQYIIASSSTYIDFRDFRRALKHFSMSRWIKEESYAF